MNYQAIYYAARMIQAYCEHADCDSCPFMRHDSFMMRDIEVCRIGAGLDPAGWELEDLENEIKSF